jgi:formylglycine-generating enzyme required for sulfatase activity
MKALTIVSSVLALALSVTLSPLPCRAERVTVASGEAEVLAAPKEESEVKAKVFKGETFEVVNQAGEWLKIKLEDGSFGYLRKSAAAVMADDAPLASLDEPDVPKAITNPKDGTALVYIPAGEFWMGSPDGEGKEDEHPRRKVWLDGYYIGECEVTQAQFRRFCQENKRDLPEQNVQGDDLPVVGVTWEDAAAYCKWAGLRLPSEAEWEKAARGGTSTVFWWGDVGLHTMANFSGISPPDIWDEVSPAGSLPPNQYGLHDTAGNVWEWVNDFYDPGYYARGPARNPPGPASGDSRVLRGGSWDGPADYMRPARRAFDVRDYFSSLLGFRCARSR